MLFNLHSRVGGHTGYNILTYNLVSGLKRILGTKNKSSDKTFCIISSQENLKDKLLEDEIKPDAISGYAPISVGLMPFMEMTKFYGNVRVGFPMYEGNVLHPFYVQNLESLDYILSPCNYLTDLYKQYINVPVYTLHAGIDTTIYNNFRKKAERRNLEEPYTKENPCVFLSVGKFEVRKSSIEVLIAFLKYFEDHPMRDKVVLKLKWVTNGFSRSYHEIKQSIAPLLKMYPYAARRVVMLDNPNQDVVRLYNDADCFLFPSKAEGVGLPVLEAMACELPSITTTYSSLKDYIDPEAAIVLEDRGMIPMSDPFFGIHPEHWGTFGKVEADDIIKAIDTFMNMSQKERLDLGHKARKHVVDNFNNIKFAENFLNIIGEIDDNRRKTEITRAINFTTRSSSSGTCNKGKCKCVENNS